MTTVTKQAKEGGGTDRKGHPFSLKSLELEIKTAFRSASYYRRLCAELWRGKVLKRQRQRLNVFWATALRVSQIKQTREAVQKRPRRRPVPGKPQRFNCNLINYLISPQCTVVTVILWPSLAPGIEQMWYMRRCVQIRAGGRLCFQLRKWVTSVRWVQVSVCSGIWPWSPVRCPAPTVSQAPVSVTVPSSILWAYLTCTQAPLPQLAGDSSSSRNGCVWLCVREREGEQQRTRRLHRSAASTVTEINAVFAVALSGGALQQMQGWHSSVFRCAPAPQTHPSVAMSPWGKPSLLFDPLSRSPSAFWWTEECLNKHCCRKSRASPYSTIPVKGTEFTGITGCSQPLTPLKTLHVFNCRLKSQTKM